jgi:hypothetical protein
MNAMAGRQFVPETVSPSDGALISFNSSSSTDSQRSNASMTAAARGYNPARPEYSK